MKCFVVRTSDDDKKWIYEEITKGKLHQGWGIPKTSLLSNGNIISEDDWIKQYKISASQNWNENISNDVAAKRYKILRTMLDIRIGDFLVVPKMPEWNTFLLCKAVGTYEFDERDSAGRDEYEDFRHTIPIDSNTIKIFGYSSSTESKLVKGKFRAYQSAVNNVWSREFIDSVQVLLKRESDYSSKDICALIDDIKPDVYKQFLPKIIDLGHREVEQIVEEIFKNAGYEVIDTHYYDGQGGDADIVLHQTIPIISEAIEDFGQKIYVQIKAKKGNDYFDEEGVDQLVKISRNEPDSLKVLISTTPKFSEKCKEKAIANDVVLISGIQLMPLIIKYL